MTRIIFGTSAEPKILTNVIICFRTRKSFVEVDDAFEMTVARTLIRRINLSINNAKERYIKSRTHINKYNACNKCIHAKNIHFS